MTQTNRRVLLVDDNPAIHDDFRKILRARCAAPVGELAFELTSAYQGADGVEPDAITCPGSATWAS